MAYLKSAPSEYQPEIVLTELSALQRLHYLEYLSEEEAALQGENQDTGAARISALNIRISARLVALSLMKTQCADVDPLDDEACKAAALQLQREILGKWSWEGIAVSALQVRRLSDMLPPERDDSDKAAADEEDVTAEKR